MWQLLTAMKDCGLKNDALMETFYELVGEHYRTDEEYAVFVFHDSYDVPVKAADKERLGESEEVFTYLICAICPLAGASPDHVAVFQADTAHPHRELESKILNHYSR